MKYSYPVSIYKFTYIGSIHRYFSLNTSAGLLTRVSFTPKGWGSLHARGGSDDPWEEVMVALGQPAKSVSIQSDVLPLLRGRLSLLSAGSIPSLSAASSVTQPLSEWPCEVNPWGSRRVDSNTTVQLDIAPSGVSGEPQLTHTREQVTRIRDW